MNVHEPHPEPGVASSHIQHISLPLDCGVGPLPGARTYVVWRADECVHGPFYLTGIHTGRGLIPWAGLEASLGPDGYQKGRCRLQQVICAEGSNPLVEAKRLYQAEARLHKVPRGREPRLFLWYTETIGQSAEVSQASASLSDSHSQSSES
eukprot:595028-Amphidinium_carterae.1